MAFLDRELLRVMFEERGLTQQQAREELTAIYPGMRGFSINNIRNLCRRYDIRNPFTANYIDDETLDIHVESAAVQLGPSWGRRLVNGYLRSRGIFADVNRVGRSLYRVNPFNQYYRRSGLNRQVNPSRYYAPYYGYSLHMDQHEKLVEYGVCAVIAVDGCSGHIASYAVMPKKNNLRIYEEVYLHAVRQYGLWEQTVTDRGAEFFLANFMQHFYRTHAVHFGGTRSAYKRVRSVINNKVERKWSDINKKVAYPIKLCLIDMVSTTYIDNHNEHHLFAISTVTVQVFIAGMNLFVPSWNQHTVPGTGIPVSHIPTRQNLHIPEAQLISTETAKLLYEQNGGRLNENSTVGIDLLDGRPELQQRRDELFQRYVAAAGGYPEIFSTTVNMLFDPLQGAIHYFITVTENLFQL